VETGSHLAVNLQKQLQIKNKYIFAMKKWKWNYIFCISNTSSKKIIFFSKKNVISEL
jgi:hypothetical protein